MIVEIFDTNGDEPELVLRAPLKSGQPVVGDKIYVEADGGAVVFHVFDRQWHFSKADDGGGVNVKMVCTASRIGEIPAGPGDGEDKDHQQVLQEKAERGE